MFVTKNYMDKNGDKWVIGGELSVIDGGFINLPKKTPVNAVAATGTLTFTDAASDGETVTIGKNIYEFDTGDGVAEGNIAVDISGGATAPTVVTALVTAMTENADVTAVDGTGDTVVITAKIKGTAANTIATTTTCVNASFGNATLSGGVDGTIADGVGFHYRDDNYLYWTVDGNGISDTNWRRISLGTSY